RSPLGAEEAPAVPLLILEDFEGATLGSEPYLWKDKAVGTEATVGAEKAELEGNASNKALKIEYEFAGSARPEQAVLAGPGLRGGSTGQPLPGALTGINAMVFGD